MPNPLIEFGIRLKQLRETQLLSQTELAEQVHVTRGTVSNWERGLSPPGFIEIRQLASTLHTTADFLLFGASTANMIA